MDKKLAIRQLIFYEFNSNNNVAETTLKVNEHFGPGSINIRSVQRWFQKFRSGQETLSDEPRSGRPIAIDVTLIENLIRENPELSLNEMRIRTGYSYGTIQSTIKSLNLIWKRGQFIPHELSAENKRKRVEIAQKNLNNLSSEKFLKRIMTSDEKWVYLNNIKPKNQWLEPGVPAGAVPKVGQHDDKVMLCIWWDYRGPIHFELLEPGQTVDTKVYVEQLTRVHSSLKAKRPELRGRYNVIFLHDNARPHISSGTRKKINEFGWTLLSHPPYSPDLAPSDYHLFRSLSHFLDGKKFETRNVAKEAIETFSASKSEQFYSKGIFDLPNRWRKTVAVGGDYFYDDN